MKLSTVIIISLFIFLLYYYTAETYDTVRIVGNHVYKFFDGVFSDVQQENDQGAYNNIKEDVKNAFTT